MPDQKGQARQRAPCEETKQAADTNHRGCRQRRQLQRKPARRDRGSNGRDGRSREALENTENVDIPAPKDMRKDRSGADRSDAGGGGGGGEPDVTPAAPRPRAAPSPRPCHVGRVLLPPRRHVGPVRTEMSGFASSVLCRQRLERCLARSRRSAAPVPRGKWKTRHNMFSMTYATWASEELS